MIRNDMVDYGHHYDSDEYQRFPERILGTDVREVLLSQILKDYDYATSIFGKWDMGQLKRYRPLQRGFDCFCGFTKIRGSITGLMNATEWPPCGVTTIPPQCIEALMRLPCFEERQYAS